jgi:DNA-binding response OmpR family regulator
MNDQHVRGSVLVVDDEPTIAEVVARYLERAGYRAAIA